jgi:translation initiation factor IF-3
MKIAIGRGLDLVEVSPEADPPVCRIMDFGKYRYEQSKREKISRKHQQTAKVKEIRLHPNIDPHDLEIKEKKAREFLAEGHKVKLTVRFKGREIMHPEHGNEIIAQLIENVKDVGAVEMKPKMFGRNITLVIGPLRSHH